MLPFGATVTNLREVTNEKASLLIGVLLVLIAEIITLIVFAVETPNFSQDTVAVNEVMQSVTEDFNILEEHKNTTALDYVVLDENGNLLYKTKSGLSESVNAAITHRDTILNITDRQRYMSARSLFITTVRKHYKHKSGRQLSFCRLQSL